MENGAVGARGQELGQSCRHLGLVLEGLGGGGHLVPQEKQGGAALWAGCQERPGRLGEGLQGVLLRRTSPGGREREAWRRSKPSSGKEGEARQGWFGTLFGCAWSRVELGKHQEREDEDKLWAAVLDGAGPRAAGGGESPTHTCRKHLAACVCSYLC